MAAQLTLALVRRLSSQPQPAASSAPAAEPPLAQVLRFESLSRWPLAAELLLTLVVAEPKPATPQAPLSFALKNLMAKEAAHLLAQPPGRRL